MIPFPEKKYQIIYADPCWQYDDKSLSHGGGAESHYSCLSIEEMCEIPVQSIAENNSILLIWVTFPMLEESFKLIKAWGFVFKTVAFTWVKTNGDGTIYMGMGRYTRANAEICLLCKRGTGLKRLDASIKQVVLSKRLKHSQKPKIFRKCISDLFGSERSKIELFSRDKIEGWDCWGNQIPDSEQRLLRTDPEQQEQTVR